MVWDWVANDPRMMLDMVLNLFNYFDNGRLPADDQAHNYVPLVPRYFHSFPKV